MARPLAGPALFGTDLFGEVVNPSKDALRTRFIVPPFTILDARSGEWQGRKRAWLALGIKSEVGRGNVQGSFAAVRALQKGIKLEGQKSAAPGGSPLPAMDYSQGERGDGKGRPIRPTSAAAITDDKLKKLAGFKSGVPQERIEAYERTKEGNKAVPIRCAFNHGDLREERDETNPEGTIETWAVSSIFDPVLCECAYRWWCPEGGQVLDPFAGGSVRGIVAGALGRHYWGADLREEQIFANNEQADELGIVPRPTWVCGDSREVIGQAPDADFIFSCPPYGNLEVYSNDPKDISSYTFKDFVAAYQEIIRLSCEKLKDNRFACFVVGDYRDKETGIYRNFIGGTVKSFQKAGLKFYNEAILVTVVGTGSLRATQQFNRGRKLVKMHQNVIVMVKGDWKKACDYLNASMKDPDAAV